MNTGCEERQSIPCVVYGAGGHGKVVLSILLRSSRYFVSCIVDDNNELKGKTILGKSVTGSGLWLASNNSLLKTVFMGIGSLGLPSVRRRIFFLLKEKAFELPYLISDSAYVSDDLVIGNGSVVINGAIINPGVFIEENVIVNTGVVIDHDCRIESNVHIAPGCVLSGNVFVGENTHIGTGTKIIQNIRIGKNSVIGAGSLILKDVDDNCLYFGTPAKKIRKIIEE